MNTMIKGVLLFGLSSLAGCAPSQAPVKPVPAVPSESGVFQTVRPLAIAKIVEAAAAENVAWQGPVATGFEGKGDSVSAGAGQWHDSALFMINANDESVAVFRRELHDELQRTIELAGAQVTEPNRSASDARSDPLQLAYTHGKHHGTIIAMIENAPKDAHKLVPSGQAPTHKLVIEVAETFQSDSP